MPLSKQKMLLNLCNSGRICELLKKLTGERVRSKLQGRVLVTITQWYDAREEKRQIEKEIGRLVSQGLSPDHMLVLSPHRKEHSSLAGLTKIKERPLVDVTEKKYGIKFSTIRAFKGLEADVVFLIGLQESRACTPADVYVGASRAKFLLYVFLSRGWSLGCGRIALTQFGSYPAD